jgi:hypothetical protein
VSGSNVVGIMVLVGLPALALIARMITKRFLEDAHDDEPERQTVSAGE